MHKICPMYDIENAGDDAAKLSIICQISKTWLTESPTWIQEMRSISQKIYCFKVYPPPTHFAFPQFEFVN